jgi:hypothetical protein
MLDVRQFRIAWRDVMLLPCKRDLLEKSELSQLVNKSPAYYGTRMFITLFTKSYH